MHRTASQIVLITLLFLLVACTPFVENENDDERENGASAPALNIGGEDADEEGDANEEGDAGESESDENDSD